MRQEWWQKYSENSFPSVKLLTPQEAVAVAHARFLCSVFWWRTQQWFHTALLVSGFPPRALQAQYTILQSFVYLWYFFTAFQEVSWSISPHIKRWSRVRPRSQRWVKMTEAASHGDSVVRVCLKQRNAALKKGPKTLVVANSSPDGPVMLIMWVSECVGEREWDRDSLPHPCVTASAYLCLVKTRTLTRVHILGSVIQSAGAASTSREHLQSSREPNPLRWETVTMDTPAYGWARAFQWGQIMIDASSRSLHNSLCIPNSPERLCRSQMSKWTLILLSLTIKLSR